MKKVILVLVMMIGLLSCETGTYITDSIVPDDNVNGIPCATWIHNTTQGDVNITKSLKLSLDYTLVYTTLEENTSTGTSIGSSEELVYEYDVDSNAGIIYFNPNYLQFGIQEDVNGVPGFSLNIYDIEIYISECNN
jgi:hypothetical protein